jgi:hypothetical protein
MMDAQRRSTPLILIAGPDSSGADLAARGWQGHGAIVVRARDWRGCLRMATALGPDVIAADRGIPPKVLAYIRAHPVSRNAQVEWLPTSTIAAGRRDPSSAAAA